MLVVFDIRIVSVVMYVLHTLFITTETQYSTLTEYYDYSDTNQHNQLGYIISHNPQKHYTDLDD